jgi:hypothetical protein
VDWQITVHSELRYVEVITSGIGDNVSSENMAKDIAQIMRKNKITRAIVDHTNISSIVGDVIEIYERPLFFRALGIILGITIAEVIKPEHKEHFDFFETVCKNRGYIFKVFYNREEALKWLLN